MRQKIVVKCMEKNKESCCAMKEREREGEGNRKFSCDFLLPRCLLVYYKLFTIYSFPTSVGLEGRLREFLSLSLSLAHLSMDQFTTVSMHISNSYLKLFKNVTFASKLTQL